jgi:hypothetical protein
MFKKWELVLKLTHNKAKLAEYDIQSDSSDRDQQQQVSSYEDVHTPSFYVNACIWSMCIQNIQLYHKP